MRTFIALEIPDNLRNQIAELQTKLRKFYPENVKWIKPEIFHITILFLGELPEQLVSNIKNILSHHTRYLNEQKFTIVRIDFIPRVNPKIIWIKISIKSKELYDYYNLLRKTFSDQGIILDRLQLVFHITLGRLKKRLPIKEEVSFLTTELIAKEFISSNLIFYQSILSKNGARYEILQKIKLI